jgi:transcriptional regulator with GAF, ATPase, and Fis domain
VVDAAAAGRDRRGPGAVRAALCGLRNEEVERDLISQALERTSHNKAQAAKLLGISYDALRYQTKKFGLE